MNFMRIPLKKGLLGLSGLAFGALFLTLALRQFDRHQFEFALTTLRWPLIGAACALYWMALGLRVYRWRTLLVELKAVSVAAVAESLLVGYAVNNLLPARLGELFRADYAKRRLEFTRSTLLGSIIVERLLDLVAILSCLALGLLLIQTVVNAERLTTFKVIAAYALLIVVLGLLGVRTLTSRSTFITKRLSQKLARIALDLKAGLVSLNRRSRTVAICASVAIWLFEVGALWMIFQALNITLTPGQALLLMGAASLSTLVPTAPGYVGTYQFVFALAMGAFGLPETLGVVASTLVQCFLFGSVTLAGLGCYFTRTVFALRDRPTPDSAPGLVNG